MIDSARRPFPLFVAGALLYSGAVALCRPLAAGGDMLRLLEILMPLFGLPYLLLGGRAGWRLALYFLLLVPAFHYLAILAAIESANWRASGFVPGAVGGLVGSLLSFGALAALRLGASRTLGTAVLGVAILAFLGGVGIWKMDAFAGTALDDYGLLLVLYLPWQIAFGFFLARLLGRRAEIGLVGAPAAA
jgi:hypothetical protein